VNINGYCSLGHSIEGGSQTTFILDAGTVDVGLAPPEGAPDDLVLGWEDSDANVDLTLNGGVMTVAGAIYFGRSDDGYGTPITRTGANTGQLRINIAGGTLQAEDYIVTSILIPGTYVPGDADNNGQVDEIDAQVLATNWGSSGTEIDWEDGDFDDDDMVGPRDAAIMAANWYAANSTESDHLITLSAGYLRINGSAMSEAEMEALIGTDIVCPNGYSIYTDGAYTVLTSGATEAGAVPEPSTLMLLASAVFGLLLWRRK
ncbi:MAG: PEP-CTERM sorting domain-containing protein, partial [Pirellulales bacterium]|nr:PEP-CTERM sorting domain-containing protein [Pirellulales bacterium]